MEIKKSRKSVKFVILLIIVGLISAWCTYKSIYYGCDIDESYAITMSYRMVLGDHLFKEMWEIHQTSAIFMAPFIYIYRIFNGTTLGMVVFLRIMGCLVQFILAIGLWHCLGKYCTKIQALLLASIFYNFSPKFIQVFDFSMLEYLGMMIFEMCLLYFLYYHKKIFLVLAGIAFSIMVLAYPQIILSFPIEVITLYCIFKKKCNKKDALKMIGIVIGTEVLCGILFMLYVLRYVTINELLANIPMILADNSHQLELCKRITELFTNGFQYVIPSLFLIALFEILVFTGRVLKTKRKVENMFLFAHLLVPILFIIKYIYMGICHLDLSYVIFCMLFALLYLNCRRREFLSTEIFYQVILGIIIFFLCCIGSNLSFHDNGGILLPTVILLWIEFIRVRNGCGEIQTDKMFLNIVLVFMCLYFWVGRAVLVRYTCVQRLTVFDTTYTMEMGTLKGIKLVEKEHINYAFKLDVFFKHINVTDKVFYVGRDTYLYFLTGSSVSAPTTISTPTFDKSTVEYFHRYPEKIPNVIIWDPFYEWGEDTAFLEWMIENYDIENSVDYPPLLRMIYKMS